MMGCYLLIIHFLSLALIINCKTPDICTKAICEYSFEIRQWRTMIYTSPEGAAYNIELNGTDLVVAENSWRKKLDDDVIGSVVSPSDDVITADGYIREIITINGQFPGPDIHVMAGSEVVVHVYNGLTLEGTTIHWHGIYLKDTPWMDGTAYVTQCPIIPRQKFTYRFKADPWGTHWYHAHLGSQRLDGLYGLLIIHQTLPTLPEFGVTINDWQHYSSVTYHHQNPFHREKPGTGEMLDDVRSRDFMHDNSHVAMGQFYGALINGRGRWNDDSYPLEEFHVVQGQQYQFRLVNTGVDHSFEVSIDKHKINIVSLDGFDIQPITVDSFIIHTGEAVDFQVEFDQVPDRYWMRVTTLRQGQGPYSAPDGIVKGTYGIIVYKGTLDTGDAKSTSRLCSAGDLCTVFNCPFKKYPESSYKTCIGLEQAVSTTNSTYLNDEYGLDAAEEDVFEYFYNFAFPIGTSVNARKYIPSRAPFFREDLEEYITKCEIAKCIAEGCWCTNIDEIPFNKTIQLVLLNLTPGADIMAHHVVHIHGYSFAVLKVGYQEQNDASGLWSNANPDVECYGDSLAICTKMRWKSGRPELNKLSPPVKNTVIVPVRGYTVIRFRSMNPGYWFVHCHMELHFLDGMAMILNIGPDKTAPVPNNFPNCNDFSWSTKEYNEYVEKVRQARLDNVQEAEEKSDLVLSVSTAIGAAIAFIIVGAVLPLVSIALHACCSGKEQRPKTEQMPHFDSGIYQRYPPLGGGRPLQYTTRKARREMQQPHYWFQ